MKTLFDRIVQSMLYDGMEAELEKILKSLDWNGIPFSQKNNRFYAIIPDDDDIAADWRENEIVFRFWIVEDSFWNKHHYIDDQNLGDKVDLPKGVKEIEEGLVEVVAQTREHANQIMQSAGFILLEETI